MGQRADAVAERADHEAALAGQDGAPEERRVHLPELAEARERDPVRFRLLPAEAVQGLAPDQVGERGDRYHRDREREARLEGREQDTLLGPDALDAVASALPARADYGTCRIRPDRATAPAVVATTLLAWGHRVAGTSLGVLFCTRALFERSGGSDASARDASTSGG